jgi:hypothetical protein
VYYKATDNPLDFGSVGEQPFIPNDGNSTRLEVLMFIYVSKGASRIFIANGNSREEIFVNTDAVDTVAGSLSISVSGRRTRENSASSACRLTAVHELRMGFSSPNGGSIGCSGSCYSFITSGVVDIPSYPA